MNSVRKDEADGQDITTVFGRVRSSARVVRRWARRCIRTITYSARFAGRGIRVSSTSWVAVRATVRAQRGATIEIGRGCEIHPYAMILSYGGSIRIGDLVSVNPFTIIYGIGDVTIGSGVRIATSVTVIPANHVAHRDGTPLVESGVTKLGIVIEDNVWVGAGARILDGVTIGRDAVIGAGSVVTRDVPPGARVAGVPARALP